MKAFKGLGSFRQDSSFGVWLYRIVYNGCMNRIKSKGRCSGTDGLSDDYSRINGPADETPLSEMLVSERKVIVKRVLDTMKEEEALMLKLYYLAGTPSAGFTERVMVSVVNAAGEAEGMPGKRSYVVLIAASVILTVVSLFVRLPESVVYNLPAELSYLFIPLITIATLFLVAWHLYDTIGYKQTKLS